MTAFAAIAMVLAFAALITRPFLTTQSAIEDDVREPLDVAEELWTREKAVALIAMKEAEFDLATGKLSEADHSVLRGNYEERALRAMNELKHSGSQIEASPAAPAMTSRFCTGCGNALSSDHQFCASCGTPRT
jgi:rRNA maturation endonuclease Nob1